jgi:glycerol-3-phosphate acyltransferase PlsY
MASGSRRWRRWRPAVAFPVGMFYVFGNTPTTWIAVLISALLFWRHRDNIRKLVAGRESTIGH